MRRSRQFRPSSSLELEGRIALTHTSGLAATIDVARPPADVAQTLSPSAMVPASPTSPAGGNTFSLDIKQTLQAGTPVYLQKEVSGLHGNMSHGATVVDELIVPDLATGGRTTTKWSAPAGTTDPADVEKSVDIKTVNGDTTTDQITTTMPGGGVQTEMDTVVKSGYSTTHTNVTTLANGMVQTRRYTDIQKNNSIVVTDASQPPERTTGELLLKYVDGRIIKHVNGDKTVTNETFNQPGAAKSSQTVVTSFGDAGQNQVRIIHMASNPEIVIKQDTTVWRLNPPTS